MRARLVLLVLAAIIAGACTGGPSGSSATQSPSKTLDIKRSKLDVTYSAFVDQDVHHVTSKKALEGGLDAVRQLVRSAGAKDDVSNPEFQNVDEPQTADFKKFADAVGQLAGRVQLSADRIADAAIVGMIGASPDCHTFYVAKAGVFHSRPFSPKGGGAMLPAQGTSLGGPDEAGLTGKVLPGGIAYITFSEFRVTGTYKITDAFRAILEKALAQGAKGWLIDLRGNLGGIASDLHSFFLDGEPTFSVVVKTGKAGTMSGNRNVRLPAQYQLPMVVIVNDRSASGTEIFVGSLKEAKRATIVGQKTVGCLGEASPTNYSDGGQLSVVVQELTGAATGTKYNNVGIEPDIPADDASAIDKAIEVLKQKIGG